MKIYLLKINGMFLPTVWFSELLAKLDAGKFRKSDSCDIEIVEFREVENE